MRTQSLLGITLLCLSAVPAAMDNVNRNALKPCGGRYKNWYKTGCHCIQYFNKRLSFSDAEHACRQKVAGCHLVSVHNEQENDDVLAVVLKLGGSSPRTWLGGQRVDQSTFSWTDGSSWNYENWVEDQPDTTEDAEKCVEMNWKNVGEWNDDLCTKRKPFVCAFKWL